VEGKVDGNGIDSTSLKPRKVETDPIPVPKLTSKKLSDTSFVDTWTNPPLQSPGWFAENDLETIILSIKEVGIISNENARLSGSVDGKGV
jgi:hypothetical protein